MPLLVLSLASLCAHCVPVVQYGDMVQEVEPSHAHPHQPSHALRPAPQKKWDRYGYGFGSDGYLYDFVKRSPKYAPDYYGYGSDGFLYDFAKRASRSRYYPKSRNYRYGFGSDGYLYDFVKK